MSLKIEGLKAFFGEFSVKFKFTKTPLCFKLYIAFSFSFTYH